jgi:hypothetical protein
MSIQIEGFAIVSEDGMIADANGVMPSGLIMKLTRNFCPIASITLIFLSMDDIRTSTNRHLDAVAD